MQNNEKPFFEIKKLSKRGIASLGILFNKIILEKAKWKDGDSLQIAYIFKKDRLEEIKITKQ